MRIAVYALFFWISVTSLISCDRVYVDDSADAPNIIIIQVDDLGWADLSVQGSTYYETPNIDRLASGGIRFTNGYASAAVCSPSRAALMTGRYPARLGITDWIRAEFQGGIIPDDFQISAEFVGEPDKPLLTPPNPLWLEHEEVTIAELLAETGYKTAHIGKWHLGSTNWYPETQGFDINIGGADLGEPPSYFDPYRSDRVGNIPTLEPRKEGEYLTDREAWEAIHFLEEKRDGPFFLHLAHYAVHTPIQAKETLIEYYNEKPPTFQDNPVYAAMVHSVDESVGLVIQKLKELGLYRNTLIIFTSDNGGLDRPDATRNNPFRSGKGYPYEGGIRVPFIISWPDAIEAASVSHEPVQSIDILPTVMDAAGITIPDTLELDGISLWDHILSGGDKTPGREELIWHFPHYRQGKTIPPYSIIRSGEWKLIKWWEGPEFELYNLASDIGETENLFNEEPEKAKDLHERLMIILTETGAKIPEQNPDYVKTE